MKENEFNDNEHTLPVTKECSKCSFTMKLEAKENTKGEVKYVYECSYKNCLNKEEVNG